MNGPYTIPNLENQGKNVGTINLPYLYQITSGQRHAKSLIFHFQIEKKYFRYHLKNLSSEKLNLACKDRSCQAKALLKHGNMNQQGEETIRKRETTLQIMQLFETDAILSDPKSLINFALKFANYDISYILYE